MFIINENVCNREHVYIYVLSLFWKHVLFCLNVLIAYVLQTQRCKRKQVVKALVRPAAQKNQLGSIAVSILL